MSCPLSPAARYLSFSLLFPSVTPTESSVSHSPLSSPVFPEAYVPPQLFYNGKVDYFDLQRLGGLLSHLKKTLKGWYIFVSCLLDDCFHLHSNTKLT